MTGKTVRDGREAVPRPDVLYADGSFTETDVRASARAGQIVAKVLEGIGNAVEKSGVLKGYPRVAHARDDDVFQVTQYGDIVDPGIYEKLRDPSFYGTMKDVLTGRYAAEEKDQGFLQRITGKAKQYIYGANLAGKLFVDKWLRGDNQEQYYATLMHEAVHTLFPDLEDEDAVERIGQLYAEYISANDGDEYVRDRAAKAYRGFRGFNGAGYLGNLGDPLMGGMDI